MSWREETEATARHLARLLARATPVQPVDLDAALIGRRAVLDLAATVHLDLTGLGSGTAAPTLAGLAEHPVRTLGQLIHRQPRPHPDLPLSQVVASSTSDATGKLWERVAVHASVARHHWMTALPASRPSRDAAWSALDHTAALVHAVTALDRGLAATAQAAGRPGVAQDLHQASSAGLSAAAAAVRTLAAAGPLPDVTDLRQPPTRRLLPVRDVTEVTPALRNLHEQLLAARHMSPAHVQLTAGVLARVALHAAVLAETAAPHRGGEWGPELAASLHEHGSHLVTAARTPRRTETITPGDPLPLAQATEIVRWLTAHPARPSLATPGRDLATARDIALATSNLTQVLDLVARRHHDDGQWVIPSEHAWSSALPYDWRFSSPSAPTPPLVRDLTVAAEHATTLRHSAVPTIPATTTAAATARQGMPSTADLAAALQGHENAAARPRRPGLAALSRPSALSGSPERNGVER